jgi:pimeloyl-ACP methyl ester carboxylesterase
VQLFAREDGGRRATGAVLVDGTPIGFPATLERFGQPLPGPEQFPEGLDVRASVQEIESAPPFPNIPLSVLVRTVYPPGTPAELIQAWEEQQAAQARLSCRGELEAVERAGHFIHRDRPDAVIAAIRRIVQAAHPSKARRLHPTVRPSSSKPHRGAPGRTGSKCPSSTAPPSVSAFARAHIARDLPWGSFEGLEQKVRLL